MRWDDTYLPEGQGTGYSVRRSDDGTLAVVSISGALDLSSTPTLGAAIEAEIQREPETLVVDLTDVTILSSPGVALLLRMHANAGNTRVCLIVDTSHVQRPLELLGVTEMLPVFRTLEDAVPRRGNGHD